MNLRENVHIYMTPECNSKCNFCFREIFEKGSEKDLEDIAHILVDNKVKHVIAGGGEPLLVKNIDNIFRILKDGNIYTELHTNGLLLTPKRMDELEGLVDKIAIPIDSMNTIIQKRLRGVDQVSVFKKLVKELPKRDFKLAYHTVATRMNCLSIPDIYPTIRKTEFDSWNIYLFDNQLAYNTMIKTTCIDGKHQKETYAATEEIGYLVGGEFSEKQSVNYDGQTRHVLGDFLLLRERMEEMYDDKRIKFTGLVDKRKPYAFITSNGDVKYSQFRIDAGNILRDGYEEVQKKLKSKEIFDDFMEKGSESVDMFSWPYFARICDPVMPAHFPEESDEVKKYYWPLVNRLADLFTKYYPDGVI